MKKKPENKFKSTISFIFQCLFVLACVGLIIFHIIGKFISTNEEMGLGTTMFLWILNAVILLLIINHLAHLER